MNDTLTLRNDYLFKRLLGAEENKVCLQDFLECAGLPHYNYLKIMHTRYLLPRFVFFSYTPRIAFYIPMPYTFYRYGRRITDNPYKRLRVQTLVRLGRKQTALAGLSGMHS